MSEPTAEDLRERRRRFIDQFPGLRESIRAEVANWSPPTSDEVTLLRAARRYVIEGTNPQTK